MNLLAVTHLFLYIIQIIYKLLLNKSYNIDERISFEVKSLQHLGVIKPGPGVTVSRLGVTRF